MVYSLSAGTMNVLGTLTLADTYTYSGPLNSGTINAKGNIVVSNYGKYGTALIKVNGSANQSFTAVSTGWIPGLEFASTGGTVSLIGTLRQYGNFTYTAGVVDSGTSTISFENSSTIIPGAMNFNNVTFTGVNMVYSLSAGTMNVLGTLTLADTYSGSGPLNSGTIYAAGNVVFSSYGKTGNAVLNMNGAVSSTLSIASTAATLTTTHVVAKTGGAQVSLVADTSYPAARSFTITSGVLNMAGYDFTVPATLTVGASGTLKCSGGDFTAGTLTNSGTISCPGYAGYPFNWVGTAADGLWNSATNWQGGVVPTTTDVVVFKDTYCGANCNATMNVAVNIKGIEMQSGYTGTITQGSGNSITIGSKGWKHVAGTFTGSNSNITNSGIFSLTGGTFSAPSATINQAKNFTVSGSPTFNAGTSTLNFSNTTAITITPGTVNYNNVTFPGPAACNDYNFNAGTMNILGTLNAGSVAWCSSGPRQMTNGTLKAYGPVNFSSLGFSGSAILRIAGNASGQTITTASSAYMMGLDIDAGANNVTLSSAGTFNLTAQYTVTSVGTLTTTGTTLNLISASSVNLIPGTATYNNVNINLSGSCGAYNLQTGTFNINGNLSMNSDGWCGTAGRPTNNGTLKVYGNLTLSGNGNGNGGTAIVKMAGNASGQTITAVTAAIIPTLQFDHGANSLSLSGSLVVTGASTVTTGNISMAGANFTTGSLALNGTTITKSSGVLTVGGVAVGTGSLFGGTVDP